MAKQEIESLVEGGKASPGPPLGPALGPMGLNINEVIGKINEKTADMEGMKVPVKVVVDTDTKEYEIQIGTPPTSALVKKEADIELGTQDGTQVGNIDFDQVKQIAEIKQPALLANDLKNAIKEVAGTCRTTGVTIEEMSPAEFIEKLDEGEFDEKLN